MLGRFLVAAIAGLVVWKYRDPLREYAQGNSGPAREKVEGLLGTVQATSEALLDQAKEQVSARLASARDRIRASGPEALEKDGSRSSDGRTSFSRAGAIAFEEK